MRISGNHELNYQSEAVMCHNITLLYRAIQPIVVLAFYYHTVWLHVDFVYTECVINVDYI